MKISFCRKLWLLHASHSHTFYFSSHFFISDISEEALLLNDDAAAAVGSERQCIFNASS